MYKTLIRLSLALTFVVLSTTACQDGIRQLNDWQAVFLTGGQVYYGQLTDTQGAFYKLQDVYYIRAVPATEEGQKPQLTLVKMGNELHGPEDMILLNKDHILYVENLRADGQVMKGIKEAQAAAAASPEATAKQAPLTSDTTQLSPEELEQFRKFQQSQKSSGKN